MSVYSKYSDQELVALLKEANHAAFKELYDRYWDLLLDSAYKRLDSVEEAEELVQNLLINLFVRRESLVITSSLEAYLKSALKYKVLNAYRLKSIHQRYVASEVANGVATQVAVDVAEYEAHLEMKTKALSQRLKASMAKMPEKCREVFTLGKIQQQSNKAIAEKLGISVSTVEKHMSKALKIIKEDHEGYQLCLLFFLLFLFN